MKRVFLIALALLFPGAVSEGMSLTLRAQENQNMNAQVNTGKSETVRRRHRRHRRRHIRHAIVSKTKSGATKTKEVGEATVEKSKQVGDTTVTKSKSVGSTVVDKSKTVTHKSKTTGEKVVNKSKKIVKPQ
jgi:hypothetical protein